MITRRSFCDELESYHLAHATSRHLLRRAQEDFHACEVPCRATFHEGCDSYRKPFLPKRISISSSPLSEQDGSNVATHRHTASNVGKVMSAKRPSGLGNGWAASVRIPFLKQLAHFMQHNNPEAHLRSNVPCAASMSAMRF